MATPDWEAIESAYRAGILSDQTALRALQEYIRTQCLK